VLGKPAVEGTEVLIAAVDEPVALESLDSAALAGIDVASIGISTLALFRAWVSARGGQVVSPTLLLHLDEDSTELVVVANGQPAYNRSAPVGLRKLFADVAAAGPNPFGPGELGCLDALEPHQLFLGDHGQDPAAAANEPQGAVARGWLLRLLREIRLTVDFARRDANAPSPDCIFLSGTGAQILHMPEFLAAKTGATAELWDPWAAHEAPVDVPGLDRPGARLSYATLAGALLPQQPQVPYPNLIPSRYLATRKEKARQRFLVVVSVQVVAVLILGYIFLAQHMNHMRQTIEAYQEKNRSLSSVAADLEAKQARNQIVRRFLGARSTPMEVLNQISNFDFIPDKVTLTRVEYKKDEYVKLTGHALDIAGVNAMESALRQTGLFSKVSQDQGSNAPVQLPNRGKDGTVLQFSITCEIEKPSGRSMRKTGNATVVTQP
jgi:Tfp pilus assembly protein PilN